MSCAVHPRHPPNSRPILFLDVVFNEKFMFEGKQKKNAEWMHRTDLGFTAWTFECGQSTTGLQRK